MTHKLKILLVEDSPIDAELVWLELRRAGFEFERIRVDNREDFTAAMAKPWDIILSDFDLPQFSGMQALAIKKRLQPELPFILVSGTIGEETAVEAMKAGVTDYLIKDRLVRLGAAVDHALQQSQSATERREAMRSLMLFRALADQSDDGFEVLDPNTARFLDVNAKGCTRLGYTREEFLQMHLYDIDIGLDASSWQYMVERLRRTQSVSIDGIHRCRDGTDFPVEVKLKWVDLDKAYIVASVRDISERKKNEQMLSESEERFRQLAENIDQVFWMSDPVDGRILYVSPASRAIWGREPEDFMINKGLFMETIHEDDRERVAALIESAVPDSGYEVNYRIRRPDGKIRWIHDRAFTVHDRAWRVYRMVGTATDVTERLGLEQQLRQAQKLEAIGTLAGGVAHDFNNILSAISGYTELVKLHISPRAKEDEYLDSVLEACGRASDLIRQILSFSRPQDHKRMAVSLGQLIKEPLKLLRATLPTSIEFKLSIDASLSSILADPTQIHQVIMNLCTNAWHAIGDKPGELRIALENRNLGQKDTMGELVTLEPGDYVVLTISDTGCGMSEVVRQRIFEPFFTTKEVGVGTGLGLAVVHGIMKSHGGAVSVSSELGKGSSFCLYFPVADQELLPMQKVKLKPGCVGGGERILCVDDDEGIAEVVRLMLHEAGYDCISMTDPLMAKAWLADASNSVDLLLSDLTMPHLSGLDLIQSARLVRPELAVVLMTGRPSGDLSRKLGDYGIRELMPKPLRFDSLTTTIRHALEGR